MERIPDYVPAGGRSNFRVTYRGRDVPTYVVPGSGSTEIDPPFLMSVYLDSQEIAARIEARNRTEF